LKDFSDTTIVENLYAPVMDTNVNDYYLQSLNKCAKETLQRNTDLYFKNHGTNDARFASQFGIPAVGFGPIGSNYHAPDEFVYISSLKVYYDILYKFLSITR
jgi:succinyl-diaminopimelate desuccinylase